MSERENNVSGWIVHHVARRLRIEEAAAELERAQRLSLQSKNEAGTLAAEDDGWHNPGLC